MSSAGDFIVNVRVKPFKDFPCVYYTISLSSTLERVQFHCFQAFPIVASSIEVDLSDERPYWMLSSFWMFPTSCGDHNTEQYSKIGRTSILKRSSMGFTSRVRKVRSIQDDIFLAFSMVVAMWSANLQSSDIMTPRSFNYFFISMVFPEGVVYLVSAFRLSHTFKFLVVQ